VTAPAAAAAEVTSAYRRCEQITREQARNFSYGITLLPGGKRRALSAVYAFARRIDDIGDGPLPADQKLVALEQARESLAMVADGPAAAAPEPVLVALADAARRFPIPLAAFGELIDGCEADVRGTHYGSFAELEHYCRCVAGSIGRLSLGVFGSRDLAAAQPLADALGIALQLTNILRDIREDLGAGRVYLPADDLKQFGCELAPVPPGAAAGEPGPGTLEAGQRTHAMLAAPAMAGLVRFEARRAAGWYAAGLELMPQLDRRSAACTGAMSGIYLRLLERIAADPEQALARRMSLPPRAKALVAARALAGLRDRPPVIPPVVPEPPGPAAGLAAGGGQA
jgi:15-cis-phytoene synthase